jgi:hypothetical protein
MLGEGAGAPVVAGSALLVAVDIDVELSDAVVDTAADGAKGGDPEAEDAARLHPVPRGNTKHTAISRRAVMQARTPQAPPWLSYADRKLVVAGPYVRDRDHSAGQ